ncbi:hypothetical protein DV096_07755 [Bradymonadaceae bacterium TMQ3]|nr:hypothetical protein DV096_07755 [Bradymonadaceae bacterium TMQ3]TXC76534.1 hypothetical protein FRC91_07320 [Bradymonadales bacterium TMQ1]
MHINTVGSEGDTTKGRSTMKIAALGCGAMILLVIGGLAVLFVGAVVVGLNEKMHDGRVIGFAREFVAEIETGDYHALHRHLSEDLQEEMSVEELRALLETPHHSMQVVPAMPVAVMKKGGETDRWQAQTWFGPPTAPWTIVLSFDFAREVDPDEETYVIEALKVEIALRDLSEASLAKRAMEFHKALAASDLTRAREMTDDTLAGESMGAFEQRVAALQPLAGMDAEVVAVLPLDELHADVTLAIPAHETAPFVTYRVSVMDVISAVEGPRMMTIEELDPFQNQQDANGKTVFKMLPEQQAVAQ